MIFQSCLSVHVDLIIISGLICLLYTGKACVVVNSDLLDSKISGHSYCNVRCHCCSIHYHSYISDNYRKTSI